MRRLVALVGLALLGAAPAAATPCNEAIDGFNSAIEELDGVLKRYHDCLQNTDGTDDCSSEFRRLRSEQSDFEGAVSTYKDDCDK